MKILIAFTSESGNTKKVVTLLKSALEQKKYSVKVKNALTVEKDHFNETDLILIGTPVHGYIFFGQKPASGVREMLKTGLPEDLKQKPVIGFATCLFFPAGTLTKVKKAITSKNGNYLASFTSRRSKKQTLVQELGKFIEDMYPAS
ncbi:MAG: flavodoxin family protein [Candidatus Hodarchaeales archaeon]